MSTYLPSELIELIAHNLPNNQQYKCLFLSKSWYEPFHRSLYKVVQIHTRHQLKALLPQLTRTGSLVREIYLESKNNSNHIVGITGNELDQLTLLCPYLEILDFDKAIWKYLPTTTTAPMIEKFQHLYQLPTLTRHIPHQDSLHRLNSLEFSGDIVNDLFRHGDIINQVVSNTPNLKKLVLDSSQQKKLHVIYITLMEMELMHQHLPLLEELVLNGSLKFGYYQQQQQQQQQMIKPAYNLHKLTLLKATLPPQWIYYFAQKYPQLQEMDLELVNDLKPPAVMDKKEIQSLFSVLLKSCPRLRKIEMDSSSAKTYMTSSFFDATKDHKLEEIKMKKSPYNLVTRENSEFYDLLTSRGSNLISGLGTEVNGSDLSISSILSPLSHFTKLAELTLCCGYPSFDCEIDLALEQCKNLLNLTIRSAHVTLSEKINNKNIKALLQHPLKSLYFSNVSLSTGVFDYLGSTCHSMSTLSLYECDQQASNNVMGICMPENTFDWISLNGIRFNNGDDLVHLESLNARILIVQQNNEKRWYHASNVNQCHPRIQQLNHRKSIIAQEYYFGDGVKKIQQHQDQKEETSDKKKGWKKDLLLGHVSIRCKSIKRWEFICNTTFSEF